MKKHLRKLTSLLLVLALVVCISIPAFAVSDTYNGTYNGQGFQTTYYVTANSYSATIGSSSDYTMYIKSEYWYLDGKTLKQGENSSATKTAYSALSETVPSLQSITLRYFMNATQVYWKGLTN